MIAVGFVSAVLRGGRFLVVVVVPVSVVVTRVVVLPCVVVALVRVVGVCGMLPEAQGARSEAGRSRKMGAGGSR